VAQVYSRKSDREKGIRIKKVGDNEKRRLKGSERRKKKNENAIE
jgi:hypothetical protein